MSEQHFPIRVLHVLTAMHRAGTETLLMNYYRNIDRDKIQFDFAVSSVSECDYDKEIEELGGHIFHYPRYKITNHFAYKKWWKQFFKEHPEYKIAHGHIGSTAAIYLKIAKKNGCYTIAHSHSYMAPDKSLKAMIYRIYSKPTRKIADYFFGCSKDALLDRYGMKVASDNTRSSVLPNAVDTEKFVFSEEIRQEARNEFGLSDSTLVVGTVGRLSVQKNPDGIIEIIKKLRDRAQDFKFLWIGRGELEEYIVSKIKAEGLEDYVIMTGVRNDVHRLYQAMDVFILPSIYEGLGNVLIEAQAAGLPSFCSDRVPLEAKVSNLCRHLSINDYEDWADAILHADKSNRANMYDIIAESGYDIKQNAQFLQEFYLSKRN